MGNYILCRKALSSSPFYIESMHLNIYSLEELCYFLSVSIALAQDILSDNALPEWLANECGLGTSIKDFTNIGREAAGTEKKLMWLFTVSHYFNENELRSLKLKIETFYKLPLVRRQKQKGDILVKYGKYKKGIACYEQIFEMEGVLEEGEDFRADVYYNMGTAYEKMFHGVSALDCFYKALNCKNTPDIMEAYLSAAYFDSGENELRSRAKEVGASEQTVQELLKKINDIESYELPEDIDGTIDKWIREYHLSVDQ